MIRVAENIAELDYTVSANNNTQNPVKRTRIAQSHWVIEQTEGTQSISLYSTNFINVPYDTDTFASLDVKVNMDYKVGIRAPGATVSQDVALKKDEWTRLYTVIPAKADGRTRHPVPSTDDVPESGGLILEVRNPMISTLPHDIYTPPHTALTPDQIALMKYGEFEEAKQI